MKLLFAHDTRFLQGPSDTYSEGGLTREAWSRYLVAFEQIVVVGRKLDRGLSTDDRLSIASADRVRFELFNDLSSPSSLFNRSAALEAMRRLVAKADKVIARLPSELGLLAISAAKKEGREWAVEVVDCPWAALWNHGALAGKIYAPILTMRTRIAISQAPFVIYVTERYLQDKYPSRPTAVTSSCSNVDIPPPDENALARRMGKIRSNGTSPLVFGMIANLNGRYKGIQVAIDALAAAKPFLPDFEFRVLGPGVRQVWQDAANVSGLSSECKFVGTLPSGIAVLEWLDELDVYLHPSLKEGLPRAVIEAMSRGCPVLASGVAGTPELLSADFLHTPGDAKTLAKQIIRGTKDQKWMMAAARSNFEVARRYSRPVLSNIREEFWLRFSSKGG